MKELLVLTVHERDLILLHLEEALLLKPNHSEVLEYISDNAPYFMSELLVLDNEINTKDVIYHQISQLMSDLKALPEVTVTFAFYPSRRFLKNFKTTLLGFLNQENVLLNIQLDTAIGAGYIFDFQGKVYNFSLQKLVLENVNAKK